MPEGMRSGGEGTAVSCTDSDGSENKSRSRVGASASPFPPLQRKGGPAPSLSVTERPLKAPPSRTEREKGRALALCAWGKPGPAPLARVRLSKIAHYR